jgi:hypothetical protein
MKWNDSLGHFVTDDLHITAGWHSYSAWVGADILGDPREEVVVTNSNPAAGISRILIHTKTGVVTDPPAPGLDKYLGYRIDSTPRFRDYAKFSGLRLFTERLLPGRVGTPYGVVQDRAVAGSPMTACVILPEGGAYPLSTALVDGVLPAGLTATPITHPYYGTLLAIQGTPTEAAVRRLTFQITGGGSTRLQDLWLTIEAAGCSNCADRAPVILGGGFDDAAVPGAGLYLAANTPTTVRLRAFVSDADSDTSVVAVFDRAGNPMGIYLLPTGSPGEFAAQVPAVSLPAGDYAFRFVAYDLGGHRSLPWPYVTVDGGKGPEDPPFVAPAGAAGQTAANTPRIVETYLQSTIPAAEVTESSGTVTILTRVGYVPPNHSITTVTARVLHPTIPTLSWTVNLSPGPFPGYWLGTFTAPPRTFGWGRYTVNVRAEATPNGGGTVRYSDWWPTLVAH